MAVVFAKAFDLDVPRNPHRFVDVKTDSSSYKNIIRLSSNHDRY